MQMYYMRKGLTLVLSGQYLW